VTHVNNVAHGRLVLDNLLLTCALCGYYIITVHVCCVWMIYYLHVFSVWDKLLFMCLLRDNSLVYIVFSMG
jgi:hypothetical protein